MQRIAIGQVRQETNSFNPTLTERSHFEDYGLVTGAGVVERYGDVGELAGFTELPEILGEPVEWLGLCRAVTWSGGPLVAGLVSALIEMTVAPLGGGRVDGVLLSLHGAQCAVDEPDVSGRLLQAIRAAVGPHTPLVATLDLHANVTPLMVRSADVLVGYHTFPHVDEDLTGRRAAAVLARLLASRERPAVSAWKIPMVHNGDGRATDRGIQRHLWRRIVAVEAAAEVASVGLYMVQPWLDAPHLGWTFYQAYWGDTPPLPPAEVAGECWATRRYSEEQRFVAPERLVAAARAVAGGPVAVSEYHDATNSGAPGDSTRVLAALLGDRIGEGGGLAFCVDPESVQRCRRAGVGAAVDLLLGGKRDPYSEPLAVRAEVERLGTLGYRLSGHGGHNFPVDMGRMARIRAGQVTVVLVERSGPGSSPLLYEAAGVDPRAFKIVLAKSPEGFRHDYEPFAAGILFCAAPGCATPHLGELRFTQTTRPAFPWDDLEAMDEARWAGPMAGY
jgi:microcystin degradation protein MlrC